MNRHKKYESFSELLLRMNVDMKGHRERMEQFDKKEELTEEDKDIALETHFTMGIISNLRNEVRMLIFSNTLPRKKKKFVRNSWYQMNHEGIRLL